MNAELRSTFLQTDLMPDTWNTFESVQFVSTEIETYVRNYSLPSRISQLIRFQWIVILPVLHEFQQKFLIFDSHVTANRKFGYIRSFFSSHCTFLWPWVPFWQRQRPLFDWAVILLRHPFHLQLPRILNPGANEHHSLN